MNRLLKFALLLLLPVLGFASDKALLIGIGKYQDASVNLPGIDLDVSRMHRLAQSMGFKPEQIHSLQDEQATLAGIQGALRGWFREGVGPHDRLLLYFSSHGSLVKGPNGPVGAIIPHDFQRVPGNLTNVLTGPMLAELLQTNPSHSILLIVDACHSGGLTSRKSIGRDFKPKVLIYEGMPSGDLTADLFKAGVPATKDIGQPNYGYLSACRQDQVAAATSQGSVLTLGLEEAWADLRRNQKSASLAAAHPTILAFIQSRGINEQNPELFGDNNLLNADWFTTRAGSPPPPPPPPQPAPPTGAWGALEKIAQQSSGPLDVRISKQQYLKNEMLDIVVTPGREGYLFVMSVGDGDAKPALLYPNKWEQDNHVTGGQLAIPRAGATYHIRQGLPQGMAQQKVLLVVVLSHAPDALKDLESGDGPFKDLDFEQQTTRSPFLEEAAGPAPGPSGYLAGKLIYVIKDKP
jgi:uncharacterized protein YbaR (Trm112 family)